MIRYFIGLVFIAGLILAVFAALSGVKACENMVASHYGKESGSRTADGSYFDGSQMIAAHRSWPFGTPIKVTYQGKSVKLVVRDRGPYIKGRSLDISTAAARKLGMIRAGVARVCVQRLK